jgi:pimeloyl-ACP methyl ester carboxylesterase
LTLVGIGWLIGHGGTFGCLAFGTSNPGHRGAVGRVIFSYLWSWPFLIAISAVVRELLVQYVGDVTAYISSYKIDRFEEVRQKIKECAMETATAVYRVQSQNADQVEYEKVAIVGHSLGSVIAYDTLNRLLNDDALSHNWLQICDRTCLLLTFGSPLDKIAFFFNIMGKTTRHVREQLAAVVQPLLQNRSVREKIPWVNVYSRNDVICGSLNFYDLPPNTTNPIPSIKRVENVKDVDALIPLTAHVEYWGNRTVWDRVLKEIL